MELQHDLNGRQNKIWSIIRNAKKQHHEKHQINIEIKEYQSHFEKLLNCDEQHVTINQNLKDDPIVVTHNMVSASIRLYVIERLVDLTT